MKYQLILLIALLTLRFPALAQNTPADPAAAFPATTALYLEMRTDETSLNALERLTETLFAFTSNAGPPAASAVELVQEALVNSRLENGESLPSLLPWAGERIAIGVPATSNLMQIDTSEWVIVLPILDQTGAQAFIDAASGEAAEDVNGVNVYAASPLALAMNDDVMWIGTDEVIRLLLAQPPEDEAAPANLSETPEYAKIRAALPEGAPLIGYLNYAALQNSATAAGGGALTLLWQAALQLHPAQSAAETALLAAGDPDGFGLALNVTERGVEFTLAASTSATYPTPPLATETAGAALFDLIPADSFIAFASYDLSVPLIVGGAVQYNASPGFQQLFDRLMQAVTQRQSDSSHPQPFTAETLLDDLQPLLRQAESTIGISQDDLYPLVSDEYAFAVFPGAGPTIGTALYLQSSAPQRLISIIERISELLLTDAAGTRLLSVEPTTINGADVTRVRMQGAAPLVLGVLNESVLFVTAEATAAHVLEAAGVAEGASGAAAGAREAFGTGQAALLSLDAQMLDLYTLGYPRSPALPIQTVTAAAEVRANGLVLVSLLVEVE